MSDAYCTDCKRETELVVDHSAGDTLCSECGLVLESHSIDETSEWRTFANESSNSDPNRVGGPTNPLLADSALTTVIAKTNGSSGDFLSNSLGRWQNRNGSAEQICSVANGATKKEIGRAKDFIVKTLGLETGHSVELGAIHAGDFMKRFCSNLGMSHQAVRAAEEAVKKSEEFDIRRSPISIAAVVIYIITQLSDDKKPLKDIAVATGVAEGTIRNSYKDLYPHLPKIIPSWYAKEEDLKNLSSP
ncbi:hypothetical protein F2Q70_00008726 [Brassica cretica]|uniref:TFIIB-type domain-containing protein n=1 Tax=Brassica cretica TaxID=69181 RepID=A0A8S9M2U6_BRACR|nr:hypothetical protein F2Q70_00008726 [Brassica cretica]